MIETRISFSSNLSAGLSRRDVFHCANCWIPARFLDDLDNDESIVISSIFEITRLKIDKLTLYGNYTFTNLVILQSEGPAWSKRDSSKLTRQILCRSRISIPFKDTLFHFPKFAGID